MQQVPPSLGGCSTSPPQSPLRSALELYQQQLQALHNSFLASNPSLAKVVDGPFQKFHAFLSEMVSTELLLSSHGYSLVSPYGIFSLLPAELLLRIFALLPAVDIWLGVNLTCKGWHAFVEDERFCRALCLSEISFPAGSLFHTILFPRIPFSRASSQTQTQTPKSIPISSSNNSTTVSSTLTSTLLTSLSTGTEKLVLELKTDETKENLKREILSWKPENRTWKWMYISRNAKGQPGRVGKLVSSADIEEEKRWEYFGEINSEGQREGDGLCIWGNGTVYMGQWGSNNNRHGLGKMFWKSGGSYYGQWEDGWQHGQGTLHTMDAKKNQFTFEGTWEKNFMNGFGFKYWYEHGKPETYRGYFHKTKAHGVGYRCYGNGNTYFGHYAHDRRVGLGCYTWQDGEQFVGEWRVGRWQGRFIASDKREYEQTWHEETMDKERRRNEQEREVKDPSQKYGDGIAYVQRYLESSNKPFPMSLLNNTSASTPTSNPFPPLQSASNLSATSTTSSTDL
jgi:hypothetical protein